MAASNIEDTIIFLEAHHQLASKHLKPILNSVIDIKHVSTKSAKQTFMGGFSDHLLCHNY